MYPEPDLDLLLDLPDAQPRTRLERFIYAVEHHPNKIVAYLETLIFLGLFVSLFDHLLYPSGTTSNIAWALTIIPHEMGHVICSPFGYMLTIAGGSIWQILFWVLLALNSWYLRRQPTVALACVAVVGHSFVNLARYIGDASARAMPLLFGMSKDHHDWWNILRELNLLEYDYIFAALSTGVGIVVLLAAVAAGIYMTWMHPQQPRWGRRGW